MIFARDLLVGQVLMNRHTGGISHISSIEDVSGADNPVFTLIGEIAGSGRVNRKYIKHWIALPLNWYYGTSPDCDVLYSVNTIPMEGEE